MLYEKIFQTVLEMPTCVLALYWIMEIVLWDCKHFSSERKENVFFVYSCISSINALLASIFFSSYLSLQCFWTSQPSDLSVNIIFMSGFVAKVAIFSGILVSISLTSRNNPYKKKFMKVAITYLQAVNMVFQTNRNFRASASFSRDSN